MFRLNFWAQSFMGSAGLPLSGAVDPRYGIPPALPPPPISVLYSSPPSAGIMLPEPLYRRPLIGFSDDLEKSSPELKGEDAGRAMSFGHRRQLGSAEPASWSHELGYPGSLLLHSQLEALRHYQQVREGAATASDSKCGPHRHDGGSPSANNCETSAFSLPRRRRTTCTPDRITEDHSPSPDCRTSPATSLHADDDDRSPARKTGIGL